NARTPKRRTSHFPTPTGGWDTTGRLGHDRRSRGSQNQPAPDEALGDDEPPDDRDREPARVAEEREGRRACHERPIEPHGVGQRQEPRQRLRPSREARERKEDAAEEEQHRNAGGEGIGREAM